MGLAFTKISVQLLPSSLKANNWMFTEQFHKAPAERYSSCHVLRVWVAWLAPKCLQGGDEWVYWSKAQPRANSRNSCTSEKKDLVKSFLTKICCLSVSLPLRVITIDQKKFLDRFACGFFLKWSMLSQGDSKLLNPSIWRKYWLLHNCGKEKMKRNKK